MAFSLVGSYTFTPNDRLVVIGAFDMQPGDTNIWVRITQDQPTGPWPWSYGILGWKSTFGYELGTRKAFPEPEGSVSSLGTGLPPVERTGSLTFEPRSFNLAWIRNGYPWTLTFEAQSGVAVNSSQGGVTFPVAGPDGSIPFVLADNGLANLNP